MQEQMSTLKTKYWLVDNSYKECDYMNEYRTALEKVKESIECKYDLFGRPKVFRVKNEEEYKIVLEYVNLAHMSCCDTNAHYNYDYKGKDWYFFEYNRIQNGMDGTQCEYWQETLAEKKEKFAKFCEEFELDH